MLKTRWKFVDTLGHFNHLIPINLDPSNTIIKIQIVIYVLQYLRRFIGQAVVSRYNIIPRQLAKSQKTKPGSKHRIVIQRLRLILKGRDPGYLPDP